MKEPGVDDLLRRFAAKIGNVHLGLIDHAPDSQAVPMQSIKNVLQKVKKDGGQAFFGWVFLNRQSVHGEYLVALHHAVWNPAESIACIDVTPLHQDPKYRPYCPAQAKVLFLLDEAAQPKFIGDAISPLPSHFFPATDDANLAAYVEQLNREEQTHFARLLESGNSAGDMRRTH